MDSSTTDQLHHPGPSCVAVTVIFFIFSGNGIPGTARKVVGLMLLSTSLSGGGRGASSISEAPNCLGLMLHFALGSRLTPIQDLHPPSLGVA